MQISTIFFLVLFTVSMLVCSTLRTSHARDTITKGTPLNDDNETIISAGKKFEFGFFTGLAHSDGSNRYVGIWYYELQPQTIVWVANVDQPLSPYSERNVSIGEGGNLEVMDKFSTEISGRSTNTAAKLLDTGNLVLIDDQSGKYLWQSFEHPTDTFLPGMIMTAKLKLTSGSYKFKRDEEENLYVIKEVKGEAEVHWKSGEPSDKLSTSQMPLLVSNLLTNSSSKPIIFNNKTLPYTNKISSLVRLVLNSSGVLQYYQNVTLTWFEPRYPCSVYNACGNYCSCKNKGEQEKDCTCLEGFKKNFNEEGLTDGCTRITKLCHNTSGRDTFFNLTSVKLEPTEEVVHNEFNYEAGCSDYCLDLGDCQCQAYSFVSGNPGRNGTINNAKSGCRIWKTVLKDLQEGILGGINLSVRIPLSDLNSASQPNTTTSDEPRPENSSHIKQRIVIISTAVISTIVICILSYLIYRRNIANNRRARTSTRNSGSLQPTVFIPGSHATDTAEGHSRKSIDVSFFKFQTILVATDSFSEENKLGEGGFGPVYRGIFADEQYLAVKRLSSGSGQGIEEFQNEVALIAKLQHRNLVRVLGYCVEKDERVLLYEYMPNKSLDNFIFNQQKSYLLSWRKRFDIILGVARGLLYLHQDSRLRIIHRDLKTSNILLDNEMNPKISDFGLARIVQGKQTEVNTNRVVGTYGYMAPEYALEGLFSIKSDVFSFGVIMLEIISGKRNTRFYQSREALNLLGYAWKLWETKKQVDLLDEALEGQCDQTELSKCVNIGLLCVQEDPGDRPTMANVVIMLSSESTPIPAPSQPAFIERRSLPSASSSSSTYPTAASFNKLTVTVQEGR